MVNLSSGESVDFQLYSYRFEMDKARLAIWINTPKLSDNLNRQHKLHQQIVEMLRSKKIFCFENMWGPNKFGIDIPLKTNDPDELLKRSVRVLKDAKYIDVFTEQEVVKVWEALRKTKYFNACTEGAQPPHRISQENDWKGQNDHFQPVPTAFQNVILYNLAQSEKNPNRNSDRKTNQFYDDLIRLARSKDFPATKEHRTLVDKGFTRENLMTPASDKLNAMEHMLRSRNAGLTRVMIRNAIINRTDKQINRAFLNAILGEIEASRSRFDKITENPLKEFTDLLMKERLLENLSDENLRNLNKHICSMVNAAADVYAFLLVVLSPAGPDVDPKCVNRNDDDDDYNRKGLFESFEHILNSNDNGDNHKGLFESFDHILALKKTINAFILDRIFSWIANEQPKMNASIRQKVYQIYEALPSDLVASKAQAMATDPAYELMKNAIMAAVSKQLDDIQKINAMLGEEWTKKNGSKWRYDDKQDASCIDDINTVIEKLRIEKRLQDGKLKKYQFMPIPGNGYRLIVPYPIKIGAKVGAVHLDDASTPMRSSSTTSTLLDSEDKLLLAKALYQEAQEHYKRVRSQEAIDAYLSLFELNNLEKDVLDRAHFECGAAYHALKQLDEASEQYGIVIDNHSADNKVKAEALMNRAAIFMEKQDYPAALCDTEAADKAGGLDDPALVELLREQIENLKMYTSVPGQATSSMLANG